MIWLAACGLATQQLVRWLKVRELEVDAIEIEAHARATGVAVTHTTVVVPWLWPVTGSAHVRVHFDPHGDLP